MEVGPRSAPHLRNEPRPYSAELLQLAEASQCVVRDGAGETWVGKDHHVVLVWYAVSSSRVASRCRDGKSMRLCLGYGNQHDAGPLR